MPFLEVEGLSRSFGKTPVLQNISLTMRKGEVKMKMVKLLRWCQRASNNGSPTCCKIV